jgi:WD40 repeat protein
MNAQHNINTKKPATKVPILLSLSGGQGSNIGVVGACVEENTRRRRHDDVLEDEHPASGRQKATVPRQGKPSTHVFALTKNGQTFGFDSESGESSHETRACLAGKRISAMDLYSRKGKTLLFFGTENGQCRALDIDTCKCVTVFKPHPPASRLNTSNKLHSSNSLGCIVKMKTQNGTLATGSDNGQICIWDVTTGRLKRKWVAHEEQALTSIRFNADENQADFRTIYTSGLDRSVRIWDIRLKRPEVIRFSSHRNTPTDVVALDSVVYSCAKTSIFMADTPAAETMHGANRRPVSLPALKHLEQQLNHDRHYPVSSRTTMRDIIRQRLKRLPLPQHQTTTNSIQHPLQQSVLASMPLHSNGLRPKGEYLLVHDLRSRAILRELNIVDSLTGIQEVANSTMFCSPDKGRRIVVLAGDTPSGHPKACCVNIDTGEMLYDLTMPLPLTTASRKCTAVARTDAASSASQIVMGWSNGAFVTWSLDNVHAENHNAAWREKHLATSLKHTNKEMTPRMATSERKKTLELLLKNVQEIRRKCESNHSTNLSWAEWQTRITTSISKSQKAISLCMINRSMLTSEELELSVLAAATSGMMSEAIALMRMHVRTGIGTSDELGASVMDLLPFKYHFGYGPTVVPKVFPLYNIGNKASVLIGEQCIQNIMASGRIPRENAIGGFIRLLCRCGFIEKALHKLDVSKSRGLRLGRSVYKALLQGLLLESAGGNLIKMTTLMEEMIQFNIMPSDSEFQILTDANIAEKQYESARKWLTKMIDAGTTIELGREVGIRLLYARMHNFMASQQDRVVALSCHEKKKIENDLIMFSIDIAKQCNDLKHLIVHVLLLVERHEEAYRLILTLDIGGTPPFTNDLNKVMDWLSKQKVPQPEISTTYFNHISRVAGDSVKGSTHACYMRALLFASRVDLALKHFTKLEKADGDAAAVLPPTVYNALLSAFEASDDLIGFKNTWTKMVANGNVNSQSYELMMKHHILRRNRNKTMTTYEEFLKTDLALTPLLASLVISVQTNFQELKVIWRSTSGHRWKQAVTAAIETCTNIAMHLTTHSSQQGSDGSNNILVWGSEIFFSFPVHETESEYRGAVMGLINGLCHKKVKNPVLAQKILESLQIPPPQCYGALIDCLLTNGESTRADKIVRHNFGTTLVQLIFTEFD